MFLLADFERRRLSGNLYPWLVPLLDGSNTLEKLADLVADRAGMAEVCYTLLTMEQNGYLEEGQDPSPSPPTAWRTFLAPAWQMDNQGRGSIPEPEPGFRIKCLGDVDATALATSLGELGIRSNDPDGLEVWVCDDYLRPELEAVNARALQSKRPWMLIRPLGLIPWIGPIFRPTETGCWLCLASRIEGNRVLEKVLREVSHSNVPLTAPLLGGTAVIGPVFGLAALAIARWMTIGNHLDLDGRVLSLDLSTLQTRAHKLVKRPQCAACGTIPDPETAMPHHQPIALRPQAKRFIADGGHRTLSPAQTLARYGHHLSPITGIVGELVEHRGDSSGLVHNFFSGPNLALRGNGLAFLDKHYRSCSAGKGKTRQQAETSALCEAIERYCGVWQGDEPVRWARYAELGEEAIDPRGCMNFSANQYRMRREWNQNLAKSFLKIPEPFDDEDTIAWTGYWSLNGKRSVFLPTMMSYFNVPVHPGKRYCYANSNGCAAGNCIEEAILQGFLELVERDAVAIWWYNRLARPAVKLEGFGEAYLLDLRDHYQRMGRELWILDITSDLGIPTFAAISKLIAPEPGKGDSLLLGFGTHLDARIGVLRAVTEANQLLTATDPGMEVTTGYQEGDPDMLAWLDHATLADHPYLLPKTGGIAKVAADYADLSRGDLRDDVSFCVNAAAALGQETLVLDMTRPDIGLPVVRVVVPGLRHFWPRLGPGRLFEVPLRLGWLEREQDETELNPQYIFW